MEMVTAKELKLSIIIVNYNTKDLTSRCVESIYGTMPHIEILNKKS